MKKTNLFLYVLVVIGIAAAIYISTKNTSSSENSDLRDFAIKDTTSISKIFIASQNSGKKVTLIKKEGKWTIDNKYYARQDNIDLLLEAFHGFTVRNPVAKSARENVIKQLATTSVKVEVYLEGKDQPHKTYYIGSNSLDKEGNFMLFENDSQKSSPFEINVPGFYGNLKARFFSDKRLWRSTELFAEHPENIQSIKLTYFKQKEFGFEIHKENMGWVVKNSKLEIVNKNQKIINEYLARYQKVHFEMIDIQSPQRIKDSILSVTPEFQIEVTSVSGTKNSVKGYFMPNFSKMINSSTGEPYKYDVDRLYGYVNNEDFVFLQYPTFDPLTITIQNFNPPKQ